MPYNMINAGSVGQIAFPSEMSHQDMTQALLQHIQNPDNGLADLPTALSDVHAGIAQSLEPQVKQQLTGGDKELPDAPVPKPGAQPPAAPMKKSLLQQGLVRPDKMDTAVKVLAGLQAAAMISDIITTKQYEKRGFREVDPLTHAVLGNKPSVGGMTALFGAENLAVAYLSNILSHSDHKWLRTVGKGLQADRVIGHAQAAQHNSKL